jgi:hypothetical protein
VWATSVIAPDSPRQINPVRLARKIVNKFSRVAGDPSLSGPRLLGRGGARVHRGIQPEEFVAMAAKVASGMRQGHPPPRGIDRRLLTAARLIARGKPFEVRSAGRAAVVRAQGASSWPALQVVDEGGYR